MIRATSSSLRSAVVKADSQAWLHDGMIWGLFYFIFFLVLMPRDSDLLGMG